MVPKGKVHEIQVARKPGTMLVFDRGYTDYQWFEELTGQKVGFVTRLKDKAAWVVVEQREVSEDAAQAGIAERRAASPPPAARNCVLASEQFFQAQDKPGAQAVYRGLSVWLEPLENRGQTFFRGVSQSHARKTHS